MPTELLSVILATAIISSGSFVGVATIALNQQFLSKILLSLVSLSAGTMLAAAFLHLLPESVAALGETLPFQLTLGSFIVFFALERFLHWRHCHDKAHLTEHTVGTMNLIGDAIHNFLDGVLIAASFATGAGLGVIATLAIALHEIPQEIGDFGVLLHSGFSRRPIAAGGFIYIAAADLIPELKNENSARRTVATVITFFLGIAIMALVKD